MTTIRTKPECLPIDKTPPSAASGVSQKSRAASALPRIRRWGGRWYARRVLQRHIVELVETYFPEGGHGDLVDYGCGEMPYRAFIEPRVDRYIGVDLPDNLQADAVIEPSGRTELADASARWVLSTQVLEHVSDPAAYLTECKRLLKPDGQLVLSTHGHWRFHPHPDDYWRWTSQGLRQILDDAGFEVQNWSGVLGLGAVGTLMLQDAVVRRLPKRLRGTVATVFQGVCAAADRLQSEAARQEDAAIYLVLAKPKPLAKLKPVTAGGAPS